MYIFKNRLYYATKPVSTNFTLDVLIPPFTLNLETSHKVPRQSFHLDVFRCTWKYHRHQKSLIFHGIDHFSCWPALRCHSPKWPRDGSRYAHSEHTVLWAWPQGSFRFYCEMQWQAQFSFSPTTWLGSIFITLFHCPLPSFRLLHHGISPQHFIFWSREISQVPFHRMEIFLH